MRSSRLGAAEDVDQRYVWWQEWSKCWSWVAIQLENRLRPRSKLVSMFAIFEARNSQWTRSVNNNAPDMHRSNCLWYILLIFKLQVRCVSSNRIGTHCHVVVPTQCKRSESVTSGCRRWRITATKRTNVSPLHWPWPTSVLVRAAQHMEVRFKINFE